MNKFFVMLIAYETKEGEWTKKSLYECETKDEAIKNFHQMLASYINSPTYTHCAVLVVDIYGNTIRAEYWTEPEPEEEPEPEPAEEPTVSE